MNSFGVNRSPGNKDTKSGFKSPRRGSLLKNLFSKERLDVERTHEKLARVKDTIAQRIGELIKQIYSSKQNNWEKKETENKQHIALFNAIVGIVKATSTYLRTEKKKAIQRHSLHLSWKIFTHTTNGPKSIVQNNQRIRRRVRADHDSAFN